MEDAVGEKVCVDTDERVPDGRNRAQVALRIVHAAVAGLEEVSDPGRSELGDAMRLVGAEDRASAHMREKGGPDSWWRLAAETLERFPEDGTAMRMAADALIDAALSNDAVEKIPKLAADQREKLEQGAALLQSHWEMWCAAMRMPATPVGSSSR